MRVAGWPSGKSYFSGRQTFMVRLKKISKFGVEMAETDNCSGKFPNRFTYPSSGQDLWAQSDSFIILTKFHHDSPNTINFQ